MTEASTATRGDDGTDSGSSSLLDALPTDKLLEAGRTLVSTVAEKAVDMALERIDGLTEKLTGVAENGGVGLGSALGGGKAMLQGNNPVGGAISGGFSAIKDKVTGALGMGGGEDDEGGDDEGGDGEGEESGGGSSGSGRGKFKFMNITEQVDVGVPVRVAYDAWTQFGEFSGFMKKVESVNQEDDAKQTWKAQVFLSHRTWEATIREQVPDSHIIWVSEGAKGHADGCVSFHEIAPNMTRILLVMEYYPQGFFEKTANLWRAVGRRARLEFKHFARHVTMDTLINRDELEGWRGEIRDSEVVKTHEEAMQEEQDALDQESDEEQDVADDELEGDELEGDELEDDEPADDELDEDELADDELDDDELADDELADGSEDEDEAAEDVDAEDEFDDDEDADDDVPEDSEPEPEPEPERRPRRARRREAASA